MAAKTRVQAISRQLVPCSVINSVKHQRCAAEATQHSHYLVQRRLQRELERIGINDIEVTEPPGGCEVYYETLLTAEAMRFVGELVRRFDQEAEKVLCQRTVHKQHRNRTRTLPDFSPDTRHIREGAWTVAPVPSRLQCRHVELGDVSPANTDHFLAALTSSAQSIQTDFDDGHCPSWANQLKGLYNVHQAVHRKLHGVPHISEVPVLMLRPRAWNLVEHNVLVNGKEVLGPLFDFGILMFHNGRALWECNSGPFFYLSKIEGHREAELWNSIFVWSQEKLGIPQGTIKACVLVENILASFEMHEILYALRQHSAGLNCGIWDYCASIINQFGLQKDFVLPDRGFVSMDVHFLRSYMDLLIQTCHQRGCHATSGMAAAVLPPGDTKTRDQIVEQISRAKSKEVQAGVDGFLVLDVGLVHPMQQLFQKFGDGANQLDVRRSEVKVTARDLLCMPEGSVTMEGLKHNISVGILFIYAWLKGVGHFIYKGCVEDSATAEISRSQVWQWIRHGIVLGDLKVKVTRQLLQELLQGCTEQIKAGAAEVDLGPPWDKNHLATAAAIFEELVLKRDFPAFITTYLYQEHAFLAAQTI